MSIPNTLLQSSIDFSKATYLYFSRSTRPPTILYFVE